MLLVHVSEHDCSPTLWISVSVPSINVSTSKEKSVNGFDTVTNQALIVSPGFVIVFSPARLRRVTQA